MVFYHSKKPNKTEGKLFHGDCSEVFRCNADHTDVMLCHDDSRVCRRCMKPPFRILPHVLGLATWYWTTSRKQEKRRNFMVTKGKNARHHFPIKVLNHTHCGSRGVEWYPVRGEYQIQETRQQRWRLAARWAGNHLHLMVVKSLTSLANGMRQHQAIRFGTSKNWGFTRGWSKGCMKNIPKERAGTVNSASEQCMPYEGS